MSQVGFYFDQTRCTGCYTCAVACKDWHDIDAGPVNWMQVHVIGSVIGFIYIILIPQAHSFWELMALCILGSFGMAFALPASLAMTVEEGRKYGMGMTIAVFSIAFSLGMAIGPVLAGAIVDLTNINQAFYFGAAVLLAGASLFAWLTRRH